MARSQFSKIAPSSNLPPRPQCIRLRGVRQNNLKGFDLDLPLGQYIVVTGLSGAGKSSLVFDTLHAEGQRRYVETFSAYTRQFLDLLDKPKVDSVENIRPSIAIEQSNTVKTSRSTVGTMTELTDYFKVWFSHVAACFDPETGRRVEDDTPLSVWEKSRRAHADETLIVAFRIEKPAKLSWAEILTSLKGQGYARVLVPPQNAGAGCAVHRVDALLEAPAPLSDPAIGALYVAQDRLALSAENKTRFLESVETAMHFGHGDVFLFSGDEYRPLGHYARGLRSPETGRTFRAATPALFSFNSPLGACPACRGFGRIIEIDTRLAIPDRTRSIADDAIRCWEGDVYGESKKDLLVFAKKKKIPTTIPFADLTPEQQAYVIDGEPGYGENGREWPKAWYGIKGFFNWLEKNTYKMHVRIFLSRYRTYTRCPDCRGTRLQPESLCWKWQGHTLPELYQMPVGELLSLIESSADNLNDRSADIALNSIKTRLRYLTQVGLGYLTLDRSSRTLSGGEVQRVNLTSCLGTSLVDTLFVLDEPSVGLHSRDIDQLLAIIRRLTDIGNTVVVVEHDEAMIRAADQIIEIGPEPGAGGGQIVFQGPLPALLASPKSLTGAYLSGRQQVALPAQRRRIDAGTPRLRFTDVSKHNLHHLDLALPLSRFICVSGVSGSGKSTLLDHVVHQGLLAARQQLVEDPAEIRAISGADAVGEIVLIDQSPLSRTPRSNPALYTDAWDLIRELYARTPAAAENGFDASHFSFNSGNGRCDHCRGLGYERVEMQFLSDVFVPCPICDGRRFKPEVLAVRWNELSIADLLDTTVADALKLFGDYASIHSRLAALDAVGLGYLTLGQPLNTLSGGESQRLKLVKYLSGFTAPEAKPAARARSLRSASSKSKKSAALPSPAAAPKGALLLLDEPTTGLHRHDVKRLVSVLQTLADRGHSVVVIEHNLDVLKSADWLIEIGPEAGAAGGRIVAEGTPEQLARLHTATSPYLRKALREKIDDDDDDAALPLAAESPAPYKTTAAGSPNAVHLLGARENNLKNLSIDIPHRQLSVVTGVSGSGKSTLAFDIVFAEGQRRFMESMSAYARQFVEQLPRPDIDLLTGIPPTVAIEQRITHGSRKSTVATITEVAQYLRLLYARIGIQHHPETDRPVRPLSLGQLRQLLAKVLATPAATRARHLYLCAPLIRGRKGHHQPIADWIAKQGYELMRADGVLTPVDAFKKLDRYKEHDIEVITADLRKETAHGDALEHALMRGKGSCFLLTEKGRVLNWFSTTRTDIETGESFPELDPKHFSHNSPRGWCPTCRGHGRIFSWMLDGDSDDAEDQGALLRNFGIETEDDLNDGGTLCPDCHGTRLNRISRSVKLHLKNGRAFSLPGLLGLTPNELLDALRALELDERAQHIVQDVFPQIEERLKFLEHVGLEYLPMDRATNTLSGGEAQRIRLAAQLGTQLAGVLYVLDEPSIGLHARDNERLIKTLLSLRDKGNTLLVVEHDDELISQADRLFDLGPGAGIHGGSLLAEGTPAEVRANTHSITGRFLATGIPHPLRGEYRPVSPSAPARGKTRGDRTEWLELKKVAYRNLRGFDLRVPLGRLVMVAGPSGAGKSTLLRDVLHPAVHCAIKAGKPSLSGRAFLRSGAFGDETKTPPFATLSGVGKFRSVIEVDQSPIGKTPRSTPATYLGIFDLIRQFFATLPEARMRGYNAGRFSFNTAGGRCETCSGAGRIKFEMAFMPNTYLPCEECHGLRYGPELNDIIWKGRTIGQVLQLTFDEAVAFFDFHTRLQEVCRLMVDCGLGYLTLGQSSPTLSGGEAQRLKLVTELAKGLASVKERQRGEPPRNLYLLEEPTIGLHLSDCEKLIRVLHALVDQGHTVMVIEHHLDVLAEADYIIELGPDGGPHGGQLLYQGTLDGLLRVKGSPTAPYLRTKLDK